MILDRATQLTSSRQFVRVWPKASPQVRLRHWHRKIIASAEAKRPLNFQLRRSLANALGLDDAWVRLLPDNTLWHVETGVVLRHPDLV